MFIGPCIIVIVEELKTNLMSLVIFISLIICSACSKHVEQIISEIKITSDIKLVFNFSTIMKGLDHSSFAQVDCGDEVKELCEFVHFLGPAPRREHVMS